MAFKTFMGAVVDTVSTIIGTGQNPFSPVNGFTIIEEEGGYTVEGESWGFYLVFDKENQEWFVRGEGPFNL